MAWGPPNAIGISGFSSRLIAVRNANCEPDNVNVSVAGLVPATLLFGDSTSFMKGALHDRSVPSRPFPYPRSQK
jgi:hypothetical protein